MVAGAAGHGLAQDPLSLQGVGRVTRRGQVDLSQGRDTIPAKDWEGAPGGEGSNHAIDGDNPNIVYSHGFYGNFSRTDLGATPEPGGRGSGPDLLARRWPHHYSPGGHIHGSTGR